MGNFNSKKSNETPNGTSQSVNNECKLPKTSHARNDTNNPNIQYNIQSPSKINVHYKSHSNSEKRTDPTTSLVGQDIFYNKAFNDAIKPKVLRKTGNTIGISKPSTPSSFVSDFPKPLTKDYELLHGSTKTCCKEKDVSYAVINIRPKVESTTTCFDKKNNLSPNKFTINIRPIDESTTTYCGKEKCASQTNIKDSEIESTIGIPNPPSLKPLTRDSFMTEWFSWKKEFLAYLKLIDQAENHKNMWGTLLLNRMGPIGQEICRTFALDENQQDMHIILLKKFDFYCIFGGRKQGHNEEIEKYVNSLMVMASKHADEINGDELVKEKILMEIDKNKFICKAKCFIPGFLFSSSVSSLTVKEMTYIWMLCENVDLKRSEEINNFQVKNCRNCGKTHLLNECFALGKQCNKCGMKNHIWQRCPSQFFTNCMYCGESHFYRECPAYGNMCNRCHMPNHFSWKCRIPMLNTCNFCPFSHIASRSKCPALNSICATCKERGHFTVKCRKGKRRY